MTTKKRPGPQGGDEMNYATKLQNFSENSKETEKFIWERLSAIAATFKDKPQTAVDAFLGGVEALADSVATNTPPSEQEANSGVIFDNTYFTDTTAAIPYFDIWSDDDDEGIAFLFTHNGIGHCARGNLTVVKGRKGCRKSFLATELAMAGCGKSDIFTLNATQPLKVLWADNEQGSTVFRQRARAACGARGVTADYPIRFLEQLAEEREERLATFTAAVEDFKPDLAIVDVITELTPPGADRQNDTAKDYIATFSQLADKHNCSIVCVIHMNKSAEDFNAAGHVGTVLEQKAAEVYSLDALKCEIKVDKYRFGPQPAAIPFVHSADGSTITGNADMVAEQRQQQERDLCARVFAHLCDGGKLEQGKVRANILASEICATLRYADRRAKAKIAEWLQMCILSKFEKSKREVYYACTLTGQKCHIV